ncbi:hypothetical protein DPMN_028273 [Dreissena polymorpha]|uniref:Uncharacterized protein n=1 Tax=Dreissena polymorpha TaxID=45954 RepID=A0A9D4LWP9_DREPO|nr:hypothetical protein DPMN_028273 [Dreissena polymorpha]
MLVDFHIFHSTFTQADKAQIGVHVNAAASVGAIARERGTHWEKVSPSALLPVMIEVAALHVRAVVSLPLSLYASLQPARYSVHSRASSSQCIFEGRNCLTKHGICLT